MATMLQGETEPFEYHPLFIEAHSKKGYVALDKCFGPATSLANHSDMITALDTILVGYQQSYKCIIITDFDL